MKRAIIAASLTLAGCNNSGDPSICTPIFDPSPPANMAEAMANQTDSGWLSNRASTCVHRMAYRLALSSDHAETVAKAVMSACSAAISSSTEATAEHMAKVFNRSDQEFYYQTVDQFTTQFEQEALAKVVEGRAGKCKAPPVS